MSRLLRTALILTCLAAPAARAEVPRVVTDIPPVQSLVASVMGDLGTPDLLIPQGASPHDHALRPSEAEALQEADLIFWIGPELAPWLDRAMDNLAGGATSTALLSVSGTNIYAFRESEAFEEHGDHDEHAEDGHDEHGHDEHDEDGHEEESHDDHADEGHGEDGHDDHAEEGHDDEGHDDHAEDGHDGHAHANGGPDPHVWLDPDNAALWLGEIARQLGDADPANRDIYTANAAAATAQIEQAVNQIKADLAGVPASGFLISHDSIQYFERYFGLTGAGAVSDGHAVRPGAARIAALRGLIREGGITCILVEPSTNPALLAPVTEGANIRLTEIDPLGYDLAPGADLYANLLTQLSQGIAACTGP